MRSNKCLMNGENTLVPIHKNKGDMQNCANYREIKLMNHTIKLWEIVIERRLRIKTQVIENQFSFSLKGQP